MSMENVDEQGIYRTTLMKPLSVISMLRITKIYPDVQTETDTMNVDALIENFTENLKEKGYGTELEEECTLNTSELQSKV